MHIENAPEDFRLDTENLDERLVEPTELHIDLGRGQCREVGMGPRMAYFEEVSFVGCAASRATGYALAIRWPLSNA